MYGDSTFQYTHEEPSGVLLVRIEQLLSSPLVSTLMPLIEVLLQDQSYQALVQAIGINPLRDIKSVTASIRDGDFNTIGIAAQGNFDGPQTAEVVSAIVAEMRKPNPPMLSWVGLQGVLLASPSELDWLQRGGVRIGTRVDMALAGVDPFLVVAGVLLDPASVKTKNTKAAENLRGVDRLTAELSLASEVSLKLGLHGTFSHEISALGDLLEAVFEKKPGLRLELLSITEHIEGAQAMVEHLIDGISLERFGGTLWLKLSWSNEVFIECLSNGVFKAVINYFKKSD